MKTIKLYGEWTKCENVKLNSRENGKFTFFFKYFNQSIHELYPNSLYCNGN